MPKNENKNDTAGVEKNAIKASDLAPVVAPAKPDLVIKSEADAIAFLELARSGQAESIKNIRFDGWPTLRIILDGKQYHGTITPAAMNGFLSIQREINRSYTIAKYGEPRLQSLSDEERQALELQIKVGNGSADFISDNADAIINNTFEMLRSMESIHLAVVLTVIAVGFFGKQISGMYFQHKKEIREAELDAEQASAVRDHAKFVSEEETKRFAQLTSFLAQDKRAAQILESSNLGRDGFLKSVKSADSVNVQGNVVSGAFLQEINSSDRRAFAIKTLHRTCRILRVDSTNETKLKVKILLDDSGQQVDAELEDQTMDARHKQEIRNALFDRRSIELVIDARTFGDQLKDVKIIGTSPHKGASTEKGVA